MHDESITQCWLFPPLFDKPFVNAVGPKALYRLGEALVKAVIGGPEFDIIQVRPDDLTQLQIEARL